VGKAKFPPINDPKYFWCHGKVSSYSFDFLSTSTSFVHDLISYFSIYSKEMLEHLEVKACNLSDS